MREYIGLIFDLSKGLDPILYKFLSNNPLKARDKMEEKYNSDCQIFIFTLEEFKRFKKNINKFIY